MDVRYKLPQSELERQPILIVYIEEFLRLRRSLKAVSQPHLLARHEKGATGLYAVA